MREGNQMKYRWILFLMVVILFSSVCIGCKQEDTASNKKQAEQETEIEEDVEELLVAVNVDSSVAELPFASVLLNRGRFWGTLVFQGLLIADESINNVENDLCEEYTVSPDGKTYVFALRDDVYWHDGEKLTTEDVVFSIETCLKALEVNGYIKKGLQGIEGANQYENGEQSSITGVICDEKNVTIKMAKQDNQFLGRLAQLPILPKHCLESIPIDELGACDFWQHPVGSGPYKVVSNTDNKEAVLVLNEEYSGKKPQIKQIRYKVLENPETDEFDFTITSDPLTIKKFQKDNNYTVVKTGNLYYRYLYFNLDGRGSEAREDIKNNKIRQALTMAIDRERIIEELYKDAATAIDTGIPESDKWHNWDEKNDLSYNPMAAKEILIHEKFDFSKPLVLTRYNSDELSVRLLEAIAEDWNAVGIKTEIIGIGSNETNKLWIDTDWYDVGLKNLSAVDYSEWYYEYSSENQMWSVIMKNRPVFNVLIAALDGTKWAYEREMLYGEIQKMETEQVFKIPLAIVPQHIIYNSKNISLPDISFWNYYYHYDLTLSHWEIIKKE